MAAGVDVKTFALRPATGVGPLDGANATIRRDPRVPGAAQLWAAVPGDSGSEWARIAAWGSGQQLGEVVERQRIEPVCLLSTRDGHRWWMYRDHVFRAAAQVGDERVARAVDEHIGPEAEVPGRPAKATGDPEPFSNPRLQGPRPASGLFGEFPTPRNVGPLLGVDPVFRRSEGRVVLEAKAIDGTSLGDIATWEAEAAAVRLVEQQWSTLSRVPSTDEWWLFENRLYLAPSGVDAADVQEIISLEDRGVPEGPPAAFGSRPDIESLVAALERCRAARATVGDPAVALARLTEERYLLAQVVEVLDGAFGMWTGSAEWTGAEAHGYRAWHRKFLRDIAGAYAPGPDAPEALARQLHAAEQTAAEVAGLTAAQDVIGRFTNERIRLFDSDRPPVPAVFGQRWLDDHLPLMNEAATAGVARQAQDVLGWSAAQVSAGIVPALLDVASDELCDEVADGLRREGLDERILGLLSPRLDAQPAGPGELRVGIAREAARAILVPPETLDSSSDFDVSFAATAVRIAAGGGGAQDAGALASAETVAALDAAGADYLEQQFALAVRDLERHDRRRARIHLRRAAAADHRARATSEDLLAGALYLTAGEAARALRFFFEALSAQTLVTAEGSDVLHRDFPFSGSTVVTVAPEVRVRCPLTSGLAVWGAVAALHQLDETRAARNLLTELLVLTPSDAARAALAALPAGDGVSRHPAVERLASGDASALGEALVELAEAGELEALQDLLGAHDAPECDVSDAVAILIGAEAWETASTVAVRGLVSDPALETLVVAAGEAGSWGAIKRVVTHVGYDRLPTAARVPYARALVASDLADVAIEVLADAVAQGSREARALRARLSLEGGRFQAARKDVMRLLIDAPDDPVARGLLARLSHPEPGERPGRGAIPTEVKQRVWRRDEGACVQCGRRDALEFDHIIPVALGGADTERNLQLLCETCNRAKGADL